MLREPRRLIASIVAIAVGVGFAAATFVLSSTLEASMAKSVAGTVAGSQIVVQADPQGGQRIAPETAATISRLSGVGEIRRDVLAFVPQKTSRGEQYLMAQPVPKLTGATQVTSGRTPTQPGDVAVSTLLATERKIKVGDTLEMVVPADEPLRVSVVGVIETGPEVPNTGEAVVFALDQDLFAMTGAPGFDMVVVYGVASPEMLKSSIEALPAMKDSGVTVKTTSQYVADQRKELSQGLKAMTAFLLTFAVISLLVAALVIGNTFSILVAQRSRSLALMRCVGATRGQVFRTVVGEGLLMGVIGGVLGALGGTAVAYGVTRVALAFRVPLDVFAVTPFGILLPIAIGVLVTFLASLRPAMRATRVAPLAALRPQLVPATGQRTSSLVLATGAVLVTAGVGALLYGALKPGAKAGEFAATYLVVGVAGGIVSLAGVLLLGTVLVPACAHLLGLIPQTWGGVPGRLAVDNSKRNPSRATATASALLVGVTLITMSTVGAASADATQQRAINRIAPADVIVTARGGLPTTALPIIAANPVVAKSELVGQAVVKLNGELSGIVGMRPEARDVLRYPAYLDGLANDTVLLPAELTIANGTMVSVVGDTSTLTLRAVVSRDSPRTPTVTVETLQRLTGQVSWQAYVRLHDGQTAAVASERLSADLAAIPGVVIGGGAAMREEFSKILNIVLIVVVGLLGASVLVALVGITNTLGLSVIERTQESALLRALGLTRPELRRMIGIEALTLAGVGTLIGLALGIGYGIAGVYALMRGVATVVVTIPWLAIAGIVLVALVSGWIASILPAVRAGRIQPAAALATE